MAEHTIDGRIIRGLTLWRPWPWAFLHAGKPVENRTWRPPSWMVGGWVALHAGNRFDKDAALAMARGEFGAAAELVPLSEKDHSRSAIVAVAALSGCSMRKHTCPWSFGPRCWQLPQVHALDEPVPCRGYQGLWRLSPAVFEQVESQCRDLRWAA